MPHAAITLTDIGRDATVGAAITEVASDSAQNMFFVNDGNTLLIVNNKAASGTAVQVTIPGVVDEHGRTGQIQESVAIGEVRVFGPFSKSRWNEKPGAADPVAGTIEVQLDVQDAACVLSAIKMSPAERNF